MRKSFLVWRRHCWVTLFTTLLYHIKQISNDVNVLFYSLVYYCMICKKSIFLACLRTKVLCSQYKTNCDFRFIISLSFPIKLFTLIRLGNRSKTKMNVCLIISKLFYYGKIHPREKNYIKTIVLESPHRTE